MDRVWQKWLEYVRIWKSDLNLLMVCFLLFFVRFQTINKAPMHWQPDNNEWERNPNDKEFSLQSIDTSMNGPCTIFRNCLFIGPTSINYHLGIDVCVPSEKNMNNRLLFGWSVTLTIGHWIFLDFLLFSLWWISGRWI